MENFEDRFFQQKGVGRSGIALAFGLAVGFPEVAKYPANFVHGVIARRLCVLLDREWSAPQRLGSGRTRAVLQAVVRVDFTEKAIEYGHDHRHRMVLGVGRKKLRDALGTLQVPRPEGTLQFKDIVILADTNVLFDVLGLNRRAFGQNDAQLGQFIDDFAQIIAQVFREDSSGLR